MKEDKKVPQLRFPEFTDAWKQRKFSEVFEEYSEKKHPELPALTIIQGKGTILRDASDRNLLYDKANLTSYKLVRKDDFIVHLRTFEGGLEKANSDGIVSPAYHIFHGKNTDTRFFYPFFRSKYFIDALLKPHVYGIRDGKSIDIEGMKTISFLVPSFEEQNKIGKFVETLDNTITLQQRKLNSLQKLKKGLLQKMFPKNGENIPEIRFPEFSDAWKQRELKEVVNFSRGQGLPWADVDDLNGQFECILYGNLYTDYGTIIQNIKHKTNTDLKVKSKGNEVLIPGSDTTPTGLARALFLEKENVILGGDINILSVKHDDGPFLAYELNKLKKELIIRIKGTTVKHLQNNDLKDIVVSLPSLEEQRKISSLFSRLDNTITLQQRKLESLQKLKKGLLQQMFI